MTEAVQAEHAVEAEEKGRHLPRVPTSLIVTLLGIGLSAWFLPALTQQWHDRQKVHELRVALGSQIAAATARALIQSNAELRRTVIRQEALQHVRDPSPEYVHLYFGEPEAAQARLGRLWLPDRIEIEAKLRAYFKSIDVIRAIRAYDTTMNELFWVVSHPSVKGIDPTASDKDFQAIAASLGLAPRELARVRASFRSPPNQSIDPSVWSASAFTRITEGVLKKENEFIARLDRSHVDGYSTTTHDLIRELVP